MVIADSKSLPVSILRDSDEKETSDVVEKPHADSCASLQKSSHHVQEDDWIEYLQTHQTILQPSRGNVACHQALCSTQQWKLIAQESLKYVRGCKECCYHGSHP